MTTQLFGLIRDHPQIEDTWHIHVIDIILAMLFFGYHEGEGIFADFHFLYFRQKDDFYYFFDKHFVVYYIY